MIQGAGRLSSRATKVAREDSLCSVAQQRGLPTVFENLEKALCALMNPDVACALELRFYTGAPLVDEQGHAIGAVCVMDSEPRRFSEVEQQLLTRLSAVVMLTIKLRLASIHDLSPTNLQLQLAFNALQYSIERISELIQQQAGQEKVGVAIDKDFNYRVVNEIIDYVQGFVGGTLRIVR